MQEDNEFGVVNEVALNKFPFCPAGTAMWWEFDDHKERNKFCQKINAYFTRHGGKPKFTSINGLDTGYNKTLVLKVEVVEQATSKPGKRGKPVKTVEDLGL